MGRCKRSWATFENELLRTDNFVLQHFQDNLFLTFDMKDEKVNKFTSSVLHELNILLANVLDIVRKGKYSALIIQSAKDVFIAGADINEISSVESEKQARDVVLNGQSIFRSFEKFPLKTIAVIDGACLGGGLEFALACDYRIGVENPKTVFGLPEVNLGIIPGFGGTKRLPELIGLKKAMNMILTGKPIDGKKALRYGLIDYYLPASNLKNFNYAGIDKKRKSHWKENNLISRSVISSLSKKSVQKKTKGHYPAPEAAIRSVINGLGKSMKDANNFEAEEFVKLITAPNGKNLINLYMNSEKLKKQKLEVKGKDLDRVAVVGAGVMGSGIVWASSYYGYSTIMKDLIDESLKIGYQNIDKIYGQLKKIGKVDDRTIQSKKHKIYATSGDEGLDSVDLLIEAIVEQMHVKQKFFKDIEKIVKKDCILATNTSTLDLDEMSKYMKDRTRFVGIHFFNPVNRMPLVEIIKGSETSDETIQTALDYCKKLKKIPVVVNNSPGFLVNRILIAYLNEACLMLESGMSISGVDQVFEDFGLPMGPFTLMDTIGLDVCYHVSESLKNFYASRFAVSKLFKELHEKKLLGKKGGKGFYCYKNGQKTMNSDYATGRTSIVDFRILERGIGAMKREAEMCLEEGVVKDRDQLNTALVYGIGFPAFRGGVL